MSAPRFTAENVGDYYLGPNGRVFMLISYADKPTATLRDVENWEIRVGGVVGAPIFDGYQRLVPEGTR